MDGGCVREMGRAATDFASLPPNDDEEPRTNAAPAGCAFASDCPLRKALANPPECVTLRPALLVLEPDHSAACHFPKHLSGANSVERLATLGGE